MVGFACTTLITDAQAQEPTSVYEQAMEQIMPRNGAQFRVNPNVGVLVFHDAWQANNLASGSVHGGSILTVQNTNVVNGRVLVRISGPAWNGSLMWVNGAALDSQTTWIGGPAF